MIVITSGEREVGRGRWERDKLYKIIAGETKTPPGYTTHGIETIFYITINGE